MVDLVKGNLLEVPESIIVHGCNCFHTMGAGVARAIAKKYPEAEIADSLTAYGKAHKLGFYSFATVGGKTIVNAYTQYGYGGDTRELDYNALVDVMERILSDFSHDTVAMSKIGCGLAGGDWRIVKAILESAAENHNRTIIVYEL
jgi:O-acetyl-ADP-ribose deacetylase (regulator of RNase III)